jgi:hypothetical protein|tara:strand:- start:372 stop:518 length:147 start_codon:yes stop_codon:yes gene_type:complete
MRNKTQKALLEIMKISKPYKRDFTSKYYKTYWAAWNALNENINAGVYE